MAPAVPLLAQQAGSGYQLSARSVVPVRTTVALSAQPLTEVNYEPEYRFPVALTLTGTQYYRNGFKQSNEMRYYINTAQSWMATCAGEHAPAPTARKPDAAMAVYDFDNKTVLLLTPARKCGLAMEFDGTACAQGALGSTLKITEENWKCRKTGKKKIILTLRCEECICIDEPRGASSTMWVTFDLNANMAPAGLRSPFAPQLRVAQKTGGVLVEGHFYEDGTLKSFVTMKDLNRNANFTVSLGEYYIR